MRVKPSASMDGVHILMWGIIPVIDAVTLVVLNRQAVITSGTDVDPKRTDLSKTFHDDGLALDLRTNDVSEADGERYARALRLALGPGFDILQHGVGVERHIHIELDWRKMGRFVGAVAVVAVLAFAVV